MASSICSEAHKKTKRVFNEVVRLRQAFQDHRFKDCKIIFDNLQKPVEGMEQVFTDDAFVVISPNLESISRVANDLQKVLNSWHAIRMALINGVNPGQIIEDWQEALTVITKWLLKQAKQEASSGN